MHPVKTAISNMKLGDPTTWGGLTLFPLHSDLRSSLRYLMLAEGLRDGLVSIREVSVSGSVPDLAVENRAERPVLILDGEELVGAKQNRVANLSMLIPAKQTTIIPVSCVEQGRWAYDKDDFAVTERVQYARGRAENLASVQRSMRTTGTRHSDQAQVWSSIDAKAAAMNAASPTGAMGSIFERHAKVLDDYVRSVKPSPGQVGAIFVVGNERFGMDVFDQPKTFASLLPKLVRSYVIDVIERPIAQETSALEFNARAFLDGLLGASFDDHPAVGLGRDLGVVADGLVAGALVMDEVLVHLAAFSEPRRVRTEPTSGGQYASYRQRHGSHRRRYH